MQDRNFDDIAEKFTRNIYGTTKGEIRRAVLWQDLRQLLDGFPAGSLSVLDAGGGTGQVSSELAALGHRVTLCDISAEMLARAREHAGQKGVSHNMQFIQSPAQEMVHHLERPVDLILFHAVLEWVADPRAVLQSLCDCLRAGGALSLMFYNYNALLMRNIVLGNLNYVKAGMPKRKRRSLSPDHPLDPDQVYAWLEGMGMCIAGKTGVRVFHDYMQDKRQRVEAFDDVLALEQRYCRQEPFVSLGRYIHVVAHKPAVKDGL